MPLLWNLQTQAPEFVELENVRTALASGTYIEYEGSESVRLVDPEHPEYGTTVRDITAPMEVEQVARPETVEVGASELLGQQREQEYRESYDTFGQEVLGFVEGGLEGLSAGLIDRGASEESAMRAEVNPYAGGAGVAAGIIAPALLTGGSGLAAQAARLTPAGVIARAGEAAAVRAGKNVILREAARGAVESAGFAAGHAVGGALMSNKPLSAEAIVSEAWQGGLLGGALGGLAAHAGRIVRKADDIQAGVRASDDLLNASSDLSRSVSDHFRSAGNAWDGAVAEYGKRLDNIDTAQRAGAIPGQLDSFFSERYAAHRSAQQARERLVKALGGKPGSDPWERLEKVLATGKVKRVQQVAEALDFYGNAVARLDDVMVPRDIERALSPTPQRLGQVAAPPPGAPVSSPAAGGPKTMPGKGQAPLRPTAVGDAGAPPVEFRPTAPEMSPPRAPTLPGPQAADMKTLTPTLPAVGPGGTKRLVREGTAVLPGRGPMPSTMPPPALPDTLGPAPFPGSNRPTVPLPGRGTQATGGMAAPPAAAGAVPRPQRASGNPLQDFVLGHRVVAGPRPTDLGLQIQRKMEDLDVKFNGRLSSAGALDAAEELGIDISKIHGPIAERAVQLWALRKMAGSLGKAAAGKGSDGVVKRIIDMAAGAAAGRAAAPLGMAAAGPIGAAAVGRLASGAVRFGLKGMAGLAGIVGNGRTKVARAVDAALKGNRIRAVNTTMTALRVSYDPEAPEGAGSRDFATKAEELRRAFMNPDALRASIHEKIGEIGDMDPELAQSIEDTMMARLERLHAKLPPYLSQGAILQDPTKAPLDMQAVRNWELYEAVTHNVSLALEFAATGVVPEMVLSAFNEQHPEMKNEVLRQLMEDEDKLRRAPIDSLRGLSRLTGLPLIPEADPAYVYRQQQRFKAQREAQKTKNQPLGQAQIQGPAPTPGQAMAVGPQPTTNQ
jgi:hypothetical protein